MCDPFLLLRADVLLRISADWPNVGSHHATADLFGNERHGNPRLKREASIRPLWSSEEEKPSVPRLNRYLALANYPLQSPHYFRHFSTPSSGLKDGGTQYKILREESYLELRSMSKMQISCYIFGMQSFWSTLKRPIFALAPMEDITDAAFRRLIARHGKPDVMFTEFTSADGLVLAPKSGQRALRKKLVFDEGERPIVAQLFTASPERMEKAAQLVAELGFDGLDINMGCPDRSVEKGGCGAALIKNPALARELIRAAKRGVFSVRSTRSNIPISIKTRIGYNSDELDSWLPELLAEEPAAITIHARTRKEMSDVSSRWDTIARAVAIRDSIQNQRGDASLVQTLILGNGDVKDISDARAKAAETRCDGVMLGRAIYGNPWLFVDVMDVRHPYIPTQQDRVKALLEHLVLFDELMTGTSSYATMKKHFKAYISGWDGAKELRVKLMETENIAYAQAILADGIL